MHVHQIQKAVFCFTYNPNDSEQLVTVCSNHETKHNREKRVLSIHLKP